MKKYWIYVIILIVILILCYYKHENFIAKYKSSNNLTPYGLWIPYINYPAYKSCCKNSCNKKCITNINSNCKKCYKWCNKLC